MNKPPLPRNVWVLTITSFLTDVSSEMLVNLIPLFLVNVLGAGAAFVGLVDGIAETTASLLKLYAGVLSDRIGNRKWLTVVGYAISTLAKPFLYFASSAGWVLGVRFADRVGKGIRTAPRDSLLSASVDEKQRGLAFGLHRAGDTAGAFTGLLIASLVIYLTPNIAQTGLTRDVFQTIVLFSIIPAVLAVLTLIFFLKEAGPQGKPASAPVFRWQGLNGRFRLFLLAAVLFTLGNSSDSFIILRGQERGLGLLQVMGMALTFNAVYTLLAGPLGALSDRIGRRRLILAGWLIYGVIYLGFALSQTGAHIWALFGLYGVYYAMTEGVSKAFVADLVPQEQRGAAYGLYNAALAIMAFPASLLAGVLWQGWGGWGGFGASAPFVFGAILSLVASGVFLLIPEKG